ncbi:WXG100 family type VII secretion target [Glycomyces mayteni]|uniref:WXG100 family type VII secretion target n=1 Tax=Glycomyces mayteni TaxID=543887 RepID=A0ABW2DEE3_9ACTN
MSDNDSYQGLDPAAPAAAAPAFGSVAPAPDIETQPDEAIVAVRPGCSNPACANATAHPSEPGWQRLVSAVPVERQLFRLRPKASGMAYPTEADFRDAVAAVRPAQADAHSLARLRGAWTDDVSGRLADWSERIRSNLADLAEGWSGSDFDAFETACGQTRDLVEDLIDDVDATVASLQTTEDALYAIQGGDSGEIPYPAPQFWIDGEWHSWVSVHVRPAWWHGDCIEYTCQDAEHVLALGGAEPELATEVIDYIDERIVHYVDYYSSPVNIEREGLDPAKGLTVEEAKELAVVDAVEHYGTLVDQSWGAYDARQSEIDEDVAQRGADTDGEARSVRTVRSDKPYPAAADPAYMDLEPPPMDQPAGTSSPRATEDPSLDPPAGEPPADDAGQEPAEDDGTTGGLASGGTGTGASPFDGGFAAPAAAAPVSNGGREAAVLGAAAAGTVTGAATAAAPRGGVPVMGAPGAAGRGAPADDKEREPDVDLVEDANMWGFVNEDDDPYA